MIKATDLYIGYSVSGRPYAGVDRGRKTAERPYAGIDPDRARGAASQEPYLPSAISGPLNFTYANGQCVMLRGRNGSGKTTLMKTIAGLLKPLSGTIETGGLAILVPTRIPKVKGFTVGDFIRTGMLAESGAFRKLDNDSENRIAEAIRMMELEDLVQKDLGRISDGEFQKACIATALTRRANVLMLDEPTAFLDVENRIMVLGTLQRLAHETATTIIFSTHDIHDGALYSDSVLTL
ncbi:MAG: ABC transporter ATP-binding protein [Bacteroidales bacterium]|nr:ABC transporter ATP-binding protein [Bacteroidales bacterium]